MLHWVIKSLFCVFFTTAMTFDGKRLFEGKELNSGDPGIDMRSVVYIRNFRRNDDGTDPKIHPMYE